MTARRPHRRARSRGDWIPARSASAPWPLALLGAAAAAQVGALLIRPRRGVIAPDPVPVADHFSAEELARVRAFARPQLALDAGSALVEGAALLLVGRAAASARGAAGGERGAARARGRPRPRVAGRRRSVAARGQAPGWARVGHQALAGAALSVAVGLAPMPISALARRRALAAGLATQSWAGWARDVAKSTLIGAGLSAGAAPAILALMRRYPRVWWVPASAAVAAAGTVFTFLAPVALDPLFNRFEPLPEGPARADVLELAGRAGVRVGGVYQVDASRRTTAANAYVTGLGATKRVVLFDTLLSFFSRDEARLVVAHELAHVHHHDVPWRLVQMTLVAPAAAHAVAALVPRLGGGLREGEADPATVLPALALAAGLVGAITGAISSQLSRRIEARADSYSLRLTDAPGAFISFERRIVLRNLGDPDPPRWLTRLIASHPSTVQRIGIARAYERGAR